MLALRFPDDTGTLMIGTSSKVNIDTNEGNTFLGIGAGKSPGNTGIHNYNNTFLGTAAGNSIQDGCYNTCIGAFSGNSLSSGNDNILIGSSCGKTLNTDGNIIVGNSTIISDNSSKNVVIGHNPTVSDEVHNSIGIGNCIQINDSNTVYIGNTDTQKIILNSEIISKFSLTESEEKLITQIDTLNDSKYINHNRIILKLLEKLDNITHRLEALENTKISNSKPLEEVIPVKNSIVEEKINEVVQTADIEEVPKELIPPPPVSETTFQIPITAPSFNNYKKGKKGKKN